MNKSENTKEKFISSNDIKQEMEVKEEPVEIKNEVFSEQGLYHESDQIEMQIPCEDVKDTSIFSKPGLVEGIPVSYVSEISSSKKKTESEEDLKNDSEHKTESEEDRKNDSENKTESEEDQGNDSGSFALFNCFICNFKGGKTVLMHHIAQSHSVQVYCKCSDCSKSTPYNSILNINEPFHSYQYVFQCSKCCSEIDNENFMRKHKEHQRICSKVLPNCSQNENIERCQTICSKASQHNEPHNQNLERHPFSSDTTVLNRATNKKYKKSQPNNVFLPNQNIKYQLICSESPVLTCNNQNYKNQPDCNSTPLLKCSQNHNISICSDLPLPIFSQNQNYIKPISNDSQNQNDVHQPVCTSVPLINSQNQNIKCPLIYNDLPLLKCSQCNFETKKKCSFITHAFIHSSKKLFKCSDCLYETSSKTALRDHVLTHPPEWFKCSKCSYETYKRHLLIVHEQSHFGPKFHKCVKCSFQTKDEYYLKLHALIH